MSIYLKAVVNKSGKAFNVYNDFSGTSRKVIGQIGNNEVFVLYGGEGSFTSIVFKNPSGQFVGGCLNDMDKDYPTGNFCAGITNYPYGRATINGTSYYTFRFRRAATILNSGGSAWGSVAANMLVACNSDAVGQSYNGHKHISYVQNSSGSWVAVNGGGFVDMGFSYGSSGSSMSMYGTY